VSKASDVKLNLQLLRGELESLEFETHYLDGPENLECAYALPFPDDGCLAKDVVYIVSADELPEDARTEGHAHLIIIGAPPRRYLKRPFKTIYTNADITSKDLLSRVLRIFGRYDEWSRSMSRVIEGGGPLRDIGILSEPFFDNPVLLQGAGFKCLFHVTGSLDGLSSERYDAYLADHCGITPPLPTNSYFPSELINRLMSNPDYQSAEFTEAPTIGTSIRKSCRCLYQNIDDKEGNHIARVVVDELFHDFSDRDFALITILASYIGRAMRNWNPENFSRPRDLDYVLANLLAHRLVDEKRIALAIRGYQWNVLDDYFCMVIEPKLGDSGRKTLRASAAQLTHSLPSECYLVYQDRLVFIFNLTQTDLSQNEILQRAVPLFQGNLLCAGVSGVFSDFKDLFYYYNQAISALELGETSNSDYWYHSYEDHLLQDMVRRCRGSQIPEALRPQGLRILAEYDARKGTDLVALLRIYLEHDRSVTETVRAAFIHRSTCIRHLEKIQKISELDLDDPDIRLELEMVFHIMDATGRQRR